MHLLTFRNGNILYLFKMKDMHLLVILCVFSLQALISPFLQLNRQRKMTARLFNHDDHLAKVILLGTPFNMTGISLTSLYIVFIRNPKFFRLIGLNTSYSVSFLLFNATSGCIALLGFP